MKKILEILGGILVVLIFVIIILFTSRDESPVDAFSRIFKVFHKNHINLLADEKICQNLLDLSADNSKDVVKFYDEINRFNLKIQDYPKKQIDTLKDIGNIFIKRENTLTNGMMRIYSDSNYLYHFRDSCDYYSNILIREYKFNDTATMNSYILTIREQYSHEKGSVSQEGTELINSIIKKDRNSMTEAYSLIFKGL
jgi:hypothetical protein